MRLRTWCIILLLLLCAFAAQAELFEMELSPEWLGNYSAYSYCAAEVDFRQSFLSIQSLSIVWAGYVDPGWHARDVVMGRFRVNARDPVHLVAHGSTSWMAGAGSRQNFALQTHLSPASSWNFLLDGRTHLYLAFESDIEFDQEPQGHLSSAKLVLEATPVSEPSGLVGVLCGAGILGAFLKRRK